MAERRLPSRATPILVALLLTAVIALAFLVPRGAGDAATGPLVRAHPATGPFEGLGVWVDVYDHEAWADPPAAVADMASHGVHTLYLQTSNADRSTSFVFPGGVESFLDAAHGAGIDVVAWYLPHLTDLATDRARVFDAIGYSTPSGARFDGFALDIESEAVRDPVRRSERLVRLSLEIRDEAGPGYPLGAVVPSPVRLRDDQAYWPGFPWRDLALTDDAILPMTYYTFRTRGPVESEAYVGDAIDEIRQQVGSEAVPIQVIGGLASDASLPETLAFGRAVRDANVMGASWYSWPNVTSEQWVALARISNGSRSS
jgi:hypothetical protein